MSEADLPTPESFDQPTEAPLSAPLPPLEESVSPAATQDQEWETVNFPNAIPLEELLTQFVTELEQAETESKGEDLLVPEEIFVESSQGNEMAIASLMSSEGETEENPVKVVQILHKCNRDLINRVAELEEELDESRQNKQDKDTQLLQLTQELGATQDQVKRLFKKLEIANQVIRQQQVLVETLTQQWEVTQTRLAQMERDTALTQQRYNEQFHELVQSQNNNRELRSRLHRQQRQTLQFKVALERCLENQIQFESRKQTLETLSIITEEQSRSSSSALLTPKAAPVKPWSDSLNFNNNQINLIEDEVNLSTDVVNISEQISSELEIDFPISQGLESVISKPNSDQLFKPPVELTASIDDIPVEELPQPRFLEGELERIRLEYASFISEDADLFSLKATSEDPKNQPQSAKSIGGQSFNLGGTKSQSAGAVAVQEPDIEESSPNWPAPLIYPQRRKKLESLASIDLPTFPKENPFLPEDF
jgi:hypothetical protein